MVRYNGFQSYMMYKAESSYGSEQTADTLLGRNVSWSVTQDNTLIEERGIGDTRDFKAVHYGPFRGSGTMTFEVINFDFFQHIVGSRTGAGTLSSPYVYTGYSSGGAYEDLAIFTLEQAYDSRTDTNFTFIGCVVQSATLSVREGGLLTCSVNFIFQTSKIDTTIQSYTASTTAAWNYIQAKFERSNTKINYVSDGNITINNNLKELREINSRLITDVKAGNRNYSWSFNAVFDTGQLTTLYADFYGQAATSGPLLTGTMSITGVTLDLELTGPTNRAVTIALANSALGVITNSVGGADQWVMANFSGVSKTMTITEQVSA